MVCWLKYVVAKQIVVGLTLTSVLACKMGAMFWLWVAKTALWSTWYFYEFLTLLPSGQVFSTSPYHFAATTSISLHDFV